MSFISHYITVLEFNLEPVATKIIASISSNVPEFAYVVHFLIVSGEMGSFQASKKIKKGLPLGKGVDSRDNFQLKGLLYNKSYNKAVK